MCVLKGRRLAIRVTAYQTWNISGAIGSQVSIKRQLDANAAPSRQTRRSATNTTATFCTNII